MQSDFLRELGLLGVTARLKRLSDALSTSIKGLYQANGVDIEPSWHLVLLLLKDRSANLTRIATSLHLSQPAMTAMVHRMVAKGYLDVLQDEVDARRKNIRLSARARECLPVFERIWAAGQAAIGDILGANTAFLEQLEAFEAQVGKKGFKERALEHLGQAGSVPRSSRKGQTSKS